MSRCRFLVRATKRKPMPTGPELEDVFSVRRTSMFRYLTLAALLATQFGVVSTAMARSMTRREIKQLPMVERPSRPGHFYGNAVRRNNGH
jgi:hypothetical protein